MGTLFVNKYRTKRAVAVFSSMPLRAPPISERDNRVFISQTPFPTNWEGKKITKMADFLRKRSYWAFFKPMMSQFLSCRQTKNRPVQAMG